MKFIYKISSLILIMIIILCGVACGKDDDNENTPEPAKQDKEYSGSEENSKIEDTDEYLIKDGKTSYKVVIPAKSSANISTAAEELNDFVKEGTGVSFEIIKDDSATYTSDAQYISIGATTIRDEAGITVRNDIGRDGTQIVTKGKSVFLFGANELSSLYATYDFLTYILDFDYIYKDCYNLDRNVSEIKLKQYNEINVPDIQYRGAGYGWYVNDAMMRNRMRMQYYFGNILAVGTAVHNCLDYVQKSEYYEDHKGYWLSSDGTQLCYTAHGDADEYELMQEECLKTLQFYLKQDLVSSIITLTQEDLGAQCSCAACKEKKDECGAKSALQLLFVNDLKGRLDKWFETEEGKPYYRDYVMVFFSYHDTADVPAHLDAATGKYVPNKDANGNEIKCADGVMVWYAPIHADYTHSLYHFKNENTLQTMKGWQAVSNGKMFLWTYSTSYANYFAIYNSFDGMQDTYKLAKEMGTMYMFDQGQVDADVSLSWSALKSYLNAKLAWKTDSDIEFLTDRFFTNYFGPVADDMKALYLKQRIHLRWLSDNTAYSCARSASNTKIMVEDYWPKPVVMSWLDEYNAVIDKLRDVKRENEELYTQYYNRVATERLSVLYMMVKLYDKNTSADLINEYKMQFKADADSLGVDRIAEGGSIQSLYTDWGLL